jgi:antitoxin MazE
MMSMSKMKKQGLTESPNQCIFIVYTSDFDMDTKIQKWGNSLGLRIPKSFARELGFNEGCTVEILLEKDRLVIRPFQKEKYQLSDLLSRVKKENLHKEIPTGDAVGREAW